MVQWSVASGQWSVATDDGQLTSSHFHLSALWLDGFAEMTPQELDLLAALAPRCDRVRLAFCLEREPMESPNWLSTWSIVARTFRSCHQRLTALPDCDVSVEILERTRDRTRFAGNPVLGHLERHWANPKPRKEHLPSHEHVGPADLKRALRVAVCANPEMEATLAAQEILRHAQAGGRYRDCAVLLRSLDGYHDSLRRVFRRYEIPFFLDRRESVAHHPLAELSRYALRLAGNIGLAKDFGPNVAAYWARLQERDGYKRAVAAERKAGVEQNVVPRIRA
jgi:ATP-dependent helicase/DNAse subunit B